MAKLTAGVQYGLSSQNTYYENKELIFVKLTDSAQRSIESYLQNQNTFDKKPTIQFHGTKGELFFPSVQSNFTKFTFSLSNYQDGGYECIQQTGPKNLESLGSLPCKLQIQANDDVYETTKHRLQVVEENNKNKATRVLKTNEVVSKKGKPFIRKSVSYINTIVSSKFQEDITSRPIANHYSSRFSSNKSSNSHAHNSNVKLNDQKKLGNIISKSLKERLVHLLALKPFKKLEIYDRINREGIKEKEKNTIEKTLKQISLLKENAYHLRKYLWKDVKEDWPFYSEQEKVVIKRQKAHYITSPGSSDGGSNGSNEENNASTSHNYNKFGTVTFNKTSLNDFPDTAICKDNSMCIPSHQNKYTSKNENKINTCTKLSPTTILGEEIKSNDSLKTKNFLPELEHNIQVKNVIEMKSENFSTPPLGMEMMDHDEINNTHNDKNTSEIDDYVHNDFVSFNNDIRNDIRDLSHLYNGLQLIDFHKDYTTIDNYEQRFRYKEDYWNEFEEYNRLHPLVFKITEHFSTLQNELVRKQNFNDEEGSKFVEKQILIDYGITKNIKARHDYLHHKLEHIAKLVADFDAIAENFPLADNSLQQ